MRRMPWGISLVLVSLIVSAGQAQSCPVTQRPTSPFLPPMPYPRPIDDHLFMVGNESFWTMVGNPETSLAPWIQNRARKLWYWAPEAKSLEEQRDLVVTATRLDARGPELLLSKPESITSVGRATVTEIMTPPAGCWQIRSKFRDHELSYVVKVEEKVKPPIQAVAVKHKAKAISSPPIPQFQPPCLITPELSCPP